MDQEPKLKPTDTTLDHDLFKNAVDEFKLYLGADDFYKSDRLYSLKSKKESVIGACPAGRERSDMLNSALILLGVDVPQVNSEGKNDPYSPLSSNSNKGIALSQILELLIDDGTTISETGVKTKYLDKPIKHFVLIAQTENFLLLNGIGRTLNRLKEKYGEKLPVTVDVVIEYDVQKFERETQKFINLQRETPKL